RRRRRSTSTGSAPALQGSGRKRGSSRPRTISARISEDSPQYYGDALPGDDDSDTSSVNSLMSIVSTPEISHRQVTRQQTQYRFGESHRAGSVTGSPESSRRPSHGKITRGMSPSLSSSAAARQPGASVGRNSSSQSLSALAPGLSSLASMPSASSSSSSLLRWCGVCDAEFTRLRRPHRCRQCLEAVCASCSPARLPVPGTGSLELKRTCKACTGNLVGPQIDAVASPHRRAVAAIPATATPAAAAPAAGILRGAHARASSMTRTSLGVLSEVATSVTA
ncbi:unnamed protein product, partial [Pylaiella littoralis]